MERRKYGNDKLYSTDPAENRTNILESITDNSPIYLLRQVNLGDNLINNWLTYCVLRHLSEEENLGDRPFNLHNYDRMTAKPADFEDGYNFSYNEVDMTSEEKATLSYFEFNYLRAARSLGVQPQDEDLIRVPQMLAIPGSPLERFNKAAALDAGEIKRQADPTKQRIVIGQGGSQMVKRLNNQQVLYLAEHTRSKYPNAHISIVSDRSYLLQAIAEGRWDFKTRSSFPSMDSRSEFIRSLSDLDPGAADELIASIDVNEIAPEFYAADRVILTDSYVAWVAAAALALRTGGLITQDQMTILHTTYSPRFISVPGTRTIPSPIVEDCMRTGEIDKGSIWEKRLADYMGVNFAVDNVYSCPIDDVSIQRLVEAI